jgi:hypothetical protein
MAKRKVNIGGQEFMGEEVAFESETAERWNEYALHDGTTLKMKAVLADVVRVDGQWAPNGDPIYSVNAQIIVNTNAPESMKKKG